MSLRANIDKLILEGAAQSAARLLAELWRQESGPASAAFVVSRFDKIRDKLPLLPYRLAVLRSFTVEPLVPLLRADSYVSGIDLTVNVSDFNTYAQEILDRESRLYQFAPNAVILALRTADVAPDLWTEFADLSPEDSAGIMQRVCSSFEQLFRAFRERSSASLIVHSLEHLCFPSFGLLDAQVEMSQWAIVEQSNQELRRIARMHRDVYILDYDGLVARHGRLHWLDERKWLTTRMPIAAEQLVNLSREWLRFLLPLTGRVAKVLVVDLDNTLWGGVIGEDGITGIQVGPEYPGAAYQALQRVMLDLRQRGILLAICSKNNMDDAMEALSHHPGMLLRPEHFAAVRINWNDKVQNLREIASELNIGVDCLAFLDDNPVERERVRDALPEVWVIDLPADPSDYALALRDCLLFERLALSSEDRQRTSYYASQREIVKAEHNFDSKENFFRFLEQEAEISRVEPNTLRRIAQLTQKTNQFNLTTRRYGEQQISDIAARPDWEVLSIRLRDRFGDQGLVGVAITHDHGEACEIDTFLLSCRVIGRTVETALLSYLAENATGRGKLRLMGWFFPTKKNAPARDFYHQHGFKLERENGEGSLWTLDLRPHQIACPEWININVIHRGRN